MNKRKKLIIAILVIILIGLIGILSFIIGNNINTDYKNIQIEQKSISKQNKDKINSPKSIKNQLDDNNYYILAYMKLDNLSLNHLLSGTKEWQASSTNATNTNYAFIKYKNQLYIGDNSQSNEGLTKLITVNKDNVVISHLEGANANTPHYEYKYKNITYKKQDLINQFIHSQDDITKIKQITKNMKNNEAAATKEYADEMSENNNIMSSQVDTNNLSQDQFEKWAKVAYKQTGQSYADTQYHVDNGNQELSFYVMASTGDHITIYKTYRLNNGKLQETYGRGDDNADWTDVNVPYPGN